MCCSILTLTTEIEKWGRPPNFLLVDFYNQGPTSGSVFEVAARANGVTYNRLCCGKATRSQAAREIQLATYIGFVATLLVTLVFSF
jgi:hypothetical protein